MDLSPVSARPLSLKVESKEDISDSAGNIVAFRLKLCCESDVLKRVRPGHFLQVHINSESRRYFSEYRSGDSYSVLQGSPNRCPEKLEFLGIPLSIYRIHGSGLEPSMLKNRSRDFLPQAFRQRAELEEAKHLELLIGLVGNGTRTLHAVKVGDTVNATGPLGKAIEFPSDFESAILISGGIGIASLYPIAGHLRARGHRVILLAGARDERILQDKEGNTLADFAEIGVQCHVTDEVKEKKLVTQLASEWLGSREYAELAGRSRIYSCGPWPMLREVHKIACKWDLPCTVLVDKMMLCGVGACMSCVVRIRDKTKSSTDTGKECTHMVPSCTEGPAFESSDIVWD